jgi:hypothetical protein
VSTVGQNIHGRFKYTKPQNKYSIEKKPPDFAIRGRNGGVSIQPRRSNWQLLATSLKK